MKINYSPLFLGAMFIFGLQIQAENRSMEAMRAEAQIVLQQTGAWKAPAKHSISACELLRNDSQMAAFGYADGGFAYISKDDQVPAVLFYSNGNYAEVMKIPSLQSYLETLNGYLEYCASSNVRPSFVQEKVTWANPNGVGPIAKTMWSQGEPYNILCPTYDGKRTLTGCVATGAAMAVHTLGVPVTLSGMKKYTFMNDGDKMQTVNLDFSTLAVDHENLLDEYGSSENYLQRKAISELMYACGVAASMDYGVDASGAYCSKLDRGINTYFHGMKSVYYGQPSGHEQELYDELDAGRVVVYSGYTADNAGHCFIIDGYDKKGNVHVNLGWAGSGDCYTSLTNMAGYGTWPSYNFFQPGDAVLQFSKEEPLPEIEEGYLRMDYNHPATQIEEGKWYGLYSVGRGVLAYSSGLGDVIGNTSYVPTNDATSIAAPLMVRFIAPESGDGYYIQTGTGDYFGKLKFGGNYGTTESAQTAYTCGNIAASKTQQYFWFKNNGYTMDANGDDDRSGGISGYGSVTPSDTLGNNSWQLFPVEFSAEKFEQVKPDTEAAQKLFNPTHEYQIQLVTGNTSKFYVCTTYSGNVDDVPAPIRISNSEKKSARIVFEWNGYGWEMKDTEGRYIGVGTTLYSMGTEIPETWFFTETETPGEYRINNGMGYLGVDKRAIGAALYRNKAADWSYGVWRIIDLTEPDGIQSVSRETQEDTSIFDLQGRRISAPQQGQVYIQDGQKMVK